MASAALKPPKASMLDGPYTQGSIGPPDAPVGSHCWSSGIQLGSLGVLLPCIRTTPVKIANWNHLLTQNPIQSLVDRWW